MRVALVVCSALLFLAASAGARPDQGAIVLLDPASGRELARIAANGAVVAAVPDGRGGWFVGGSFTRLGGQRRVALARVLPSGLVDRNWSVEVGSASGRPVAVYSLARSGSLLFVAGPFGRVGGVQRAGLAAVDARTGRTVRGWRPPPSTGLDVQALGVAGQRLVVAGSRGIAALDVRTAALDTRWNARVRLIGDAGGFNSLLVRGSRVYVAGSFRVRGLRRNGLVALSSRTGKPDPPFEPRVANCSVCNGFAVVLGLAASRQRLYVSGHFRRVGGVSRNGVAALDPTTGAVDVRWRPQRGGTDVFRLVLAGSRLYLGGMSGLWALDARTGASVTLPARRTPRHVLALSLAGRRLLVAGRA